MTCWSTGGIYKELGTFKCNVTIDGANDSKCKVHIPSDAKGKTIQLILRVIDCGMPSLVAYRIMSLIYNNSGI